jgi:hypothetical protein
MARLYVRPARTPNRLVSGEECVVADLLTIWRAKTLLRRRGPIAPALRRGCGTTLPTDIDLLMHMNNGRYASLFDLGRFDLLIRTGIWDAMNARDWYAVVASESVTFRKSLELWQRFTVESASSDTTTRPSTRSTVRSSGARSTQR